MNLTDADRRAVEYLLGQLPEGEAIRLEQEILASDAQYEEMLAIEDELMYEYLQNGLSPDDRARFERRFVATDGGRRRLEFAGALVQTVGPAAHVSTSSGRVRAPGGPPWRAWAPLAAAALLAIVSAALLFEVARLRRETARLQTEQAARSGQTEQQLADARARADQLAADLERERALRNALQTPAASSRVVLALSLAPGLERSAGNLPRVIVGPDVEAIRLQLTLARPSAASGRQLTVAVRHADGRAAWSGPAEQVSGSTAVIAAEVPAASLPADDYEVAVNRAGGGAAQEIETYYISVVRPRR